MRWNATVHSLEGDMGILRMESEKKFIQIPVGCLPEGCRIGDVLEVSVSFNPFKTLEQIEKSKKEKCSQKSE